jgi:hypothetical protein
MIVPVSELSSADVASQLDDLQARATAAEARVRKLDTTVRRNFLLMPWRVAAGMLAVGWAGLLLIGLAWGSLVVVMGDTYCEHPTRSSDYGNLSWSIVPPGPQCSWGSGPGTEVEGPTPVMSIWLVLLLVVGGLTLWVARHGRVRDGADDAPSSTRT